MEVQQAGFVTFIVLTIIAGILLDGMTKLNNIISGRDLEDPAGSPGCLSFLVYGGGLYLLVVLLVYIFDL